MTELAAPPPPAVSAPSPGTVLDLRGESTSPVRLLAEFIRSRGMLYMLARHDFQARYRSASLGLAWSVLLPLLQGAVLAIVFTRIVPVKAGVNYPLFVVSGTTVWSYMSQVTQAGSTAIVDGGGIATKLYFPRMMLPIVPVIAGCVSALISTAVVLVLIPLFGAPGEWTLFLLPAPLALAALLAALLSLMFALLHVYFRDIRYLVSAIILVAFYATPILYPLSRAHHLLPLLEANPATGVLQLVRYCFFGRTPGPLAVPLLSTGLWLVFLSVVVLAAYSRHDRVACDRL